MHKGTAAVAVLALPLGFVLAAGSAQADGAALLHAQIHPLNERGASGTGVIELQGTRVTVDIYSTGLAPDLPHAQHLHIGGENLCPPGLDPDENGDGLISTTEGVPSYGPDAVSLTTEGGTGAGQKLDLERMAKADGDGDLKYHRTFEVSQEIAARIRNEEAVLVQHGIDPNDSGDYDFNGAGRSDLDASIPAEATHPATCGQLMAVPAEGMDTGFGGTAGTGPSTGMVGLGAALVAVAGAAALVWRRLPRVRA